MGKKQAAQMKTRPLLLHPHSRAWASINAHRHAAATWLRAHVFHKPSSAQGVVRSAHPPQPPASVIHVNGGNNIIAPDTQRLEVHVHYHISLGRLWPRKPKHPDGS